MGLRPSSFHDSDGWGEWVRATREALGWTQRKLAEESGVSVSTISGVERGLGGKLIVKNRLDEVLVEAVRNRDPREERGRAV